MNAMTVLTPLTKQELESFFDDHAKTVIEYFIKKTVFSQPEMREDQEIQSIQITKEHLEQWVVQALWVKWIWAGSYPVDVVDDNNHRAADVKMLHAEMNSDGSLSTNDSWEASLWQKFVWTWAILDQLFERQEYERIKNEWLEIYKEKNDKAIEEYELNNIYYFIFLRWHDFLYLVWMKVNLSELEDVTVDLDRTSDTSVFLSNFINDDLGNAKVYKSKKRLELRLRPGNRENPIIENDWENDWEIEEISEYGIKFDFSSIINNEHINLRDKVIGWTNLDDYAIEKAKNIFSNNSDNNSHD